MTNTSSPIRARAGRDWRLWLALAAVYLVWSSTYLAIRVMVETVPPLLGAGRRGRAAALVVGSVAAVVGHESPAEPAPRPFRDASGRER
jgi:hypothetical protein